MLTGKGYVVRERQRRSPEPGLPGGPGSVAGLVRVPLGLAVVTEAHPAPGPLTAELRARRTTSGNHGERAVRRRAPARVRVGRQDAAQHQVLVLGHERLLLDQRSNV